MKSDFQVQLNQINDQGIIGVEYVIEVYFGASFESIFHCVLCEGIFDLQVVLNHLTTYVHRLKYLVRTKKPFLSLILMRKTIPSTMNPLNLQLIA